MAADEPAEWLKGLSPRRRGNPGKPFVRNNWVRSIPA